MLEAAWKAAPHPALWLAYRDLKTDENLGDQARTNSIDQFKLAFDPKGMAAVLARMERNEKISNQFMSNEELRALALDLMMKQVYDQAHPRAHQPSIPHPSSGGDNYYPAKAG